VETKRGEEEYVLSESCQSAGTTRMVELESIIYSQLRFQGLLCVDEMEASMHPNLMEFILTKFMNHHDNQS
jgi:AAA15 family ATPase/GTPase